MASRLYAEQMNREASNLGFADFMKNPLLFVMQKKGINIPSQYANDPRGAVQYLLNNGQMTQEQFETLKSKATQMGVNL